MPQTRYGMFAEITMPCKSVMLWLRKYKKYKKIKVEESFFEV